MSVNAVPYDVISVDVEKGCKKAERVCVSLQSPLEPLLYVGDASGNLHAYKTSFPTSQSSGEIGMKYQQQFKRMYHDNAQLMDAWSLWITLIDTKLTLVQLPLQKEIKLTTLEETKGTIFYSAHEAAGSLVCATKPHTLLVYDWSNKNAKLIPRITHDITDKGNGLTGIMCLSSDIAVLIYKRKTILFHLDTGRTLELPSEYRDPILYGGKISGTFPTLDDFFLVWKTQGALFHYDRSENSVQLIGKPIKWPQSGPPKDIVGHFPFILAAFPDSVEVYLSMENIQSIAIKGTTFMTSLLHHSRASTIHAPLSVLVANGPCSFAVLRMQALSNLLNDYLASSRYAEAINLCSSCPIEYHLPEKELQNICLKRALQLFDNESFPEAMDHFLKSNIQPQDVLVLYPEDLLPRSYHSLVKASILQAPKTPLVGEVLERALQALITFLMSIRTQYRSEAEKNGKKELTVLIDTVLLKSYVLTNHNGLVAFCNTTPNAADVGESEVFLRAHQKWPALLAFYKTQKLYRKGLELLEELQEINRLKHNKEPQLDMVEYLRTLNDTSLIFEFSRPILETNPMLGLSIFTHRAVKSGEPDVDPMLVLGHLKSIEITKPTVVTTDDEIPIEDGNALGIEYLTQIIYANPLSTSVVSVPPALHDELVYLLLDAIQQQVSLITKKKQSMAIFHIRVHMQKGRLGSLRRQLLTFLQAPTSRYHPERLLSRTPMEMIEERAILQANMGRHEEVLRLYLHEIKDATMAEEYCNDAYGSKVADASIYTLFLQTYMRPPPSKLAFSNFRLGSSSGSLSSIGLAFVAKFMLRHAATIDVATALELLPQTTEATALSSYLQRVMELQVEARRNSQIQMQLCKIENLHVRTQLHQAHQISVDIGAQSTCTICGRKLERGAFVYDREERTIMHYACQPSA
ncbi:hypothetical protein THRCLA_06358 [Thraustotheca clavata]|uniref:Vacuolar sorting protein 39/Transforming growth factor beta receptor-associated domain-containing protein n=1 Tax=Thraustotheca clavata TaxID=74557 RepID=A0A1V9ZPE3_9STRA|nr:hypothetical protein THRCLA_06358 [Thraustotheca clavata]